MTRFGDLLGGKKEEAPAPVVEEAPAPVVEEEKPDLDPSSVERGVGGDYYVPQAKGTSPLDAG